MGNGQGSAESSSMSLPLVIRPEAEQDILGARDWYDRQREGLGDDFTEQMVIAFERLSEMPEMFSVIWEDVRTCRPKRFPYVIYYRILTDRIEVFAALHGSRHPSSMAATRLAI